jgi:diguanylate cyclase (GGDEF)-like protein
VAGEYYNNLPIDMRLGNHGTAFLPDGGTFPGGPYPAYLNLEVDHDGAVTGEVHFASEPKYPAPIAVGAEFDLHAPNPDSIVGDDVILKVKLVDDSGSVTGYVLGSTAQFWPDSTKNSRSTGENDDLLPVLRRKMFDRDLTAVSGAASKSEPASLLVLDLDRFKSVNDTYGHQVGDEALVDCAKAIGRRCRYKGQVYRYGGEEIAVLLPNFTASEAVALAESIRSEIERSTISSKQLSITVSIGVATTPDHATDAVQLLQAADEALYTAKRLGRNLVRIAGEPLDEQQVRILQRRLPEARATELAGQTGTEKQADLVIHQGPDSRFYPATSPPSVYLEIDLKVENKGDRNSVINEFDVDIREIGEYKKVKPMVRSSVQTRGAQVMTRYFWPASIQRISSSGADFVVPPNEVVAVLLPFELPAPASQVFDILHCRVRLTDTNKLSTEVELVLKGYGN